MAKIFHSTSQRAAASQPNINGRHYPATQTFYFHLTANIFRQTACKCQRFVSWIQRKSRDPSLQAITIVLVCPLRSFNPKNQRFPLNDGRVAIVLMVAWTSCKEALWQGFAGEFIDNQVHMYVCNVLDRVAVAPGARYSRQRKLYPRLCSLHRPNLYAVHLPFTSCEY